MKRSVLFGLAAILGAAMLASAAPAPRTPAAACPVEVPGVAMRCGTLSVPSRRGAAASDARIALSYAILPARRTGAAADPIVFLTGGPGSSVFAFLTKLAESPLRETRDIIALEQRGNGYSAPNLVCPEKGDDPMRACYDFLVARGVDLAAYDVTESAHDVADLKAALGIRDWNVVGVSMGTFWALHYARLHPEGVRSLILDSPVPAQAGIDDDGIAHLNGLSRVLAACAASAVCDQQYPRLRERLLETAAKLDAKPRKIGGEKVDGATFLTFAIGLTFESATVPFVPMFVDAVDKGDIRKAMKIAELDPYRLPRRFDFSKAYSLGLAVNMNCRDEAPFPAASETRLALDETWPAAVTRANVDAPAGDMRPACSSYWRVAQSDPIVNMPVASSIPALILVGAFDPQTPTEWGRAMARTLPNATLAVVPDAAHAVLSWPSACVGRLTTTFLDAPSAKLSTECLDRPRPTAFKSPDDAIALVPPSTGIDAARLQDTLNALPGLSRSMPGAALTVSTPTIDASVVSGQRAIGSREAMTSADTFRIASVTKTFVAAAALRLVEDGKLALDQPIAATAAPETVTALRAGGYDPDRITLRHLLTHTSGLPDHAETEAYRTAVSSNPTRHWTRGAQIALALSLRPARPAGERFEYSDTGYVIIGEIIERATGRRLGDAVADLVGFDHLDLTSTRWEYDGIKATAPSYFERVDTSAFDASFDLYGGGGLISTTGELAAFYRALFEGRVFKNANSLTDMTSIPRAPLPDKDGSVYAMGLATVQLSGETCWMHVGFWGVVAAYCPSTDIALALTVNTASQTGYQNIGRILQRF